MSLNNLKDKAKKDIVAIIKANQDQVIKQITLQKKAMFEENTHAWPPLLPQTIERKKREKDLFKSPETINIRKGGLFKAFINTNNYKAVQNNEDIDFTLNLDNFEEAKSNTVATHGRNVVDVTQNELDQIASSLAQIITNYLKKLK